MRFHRSWIITAAVLGIGAFAGQSWGTTLRFVSYNIDCADQSSDNNITGSAHSLPTVLKAIGLHHIGTNAQPMDIMSCEELNSTTLSNFVVQLNAIYGAGTYAFDPTTDPNTGGGSDGLIYRTNTVQVVSARALPTGATVLLQSNHTYAAAHFITQSETVPRAPMLYRLRPVGFGTNDDFYLYVSHMRSTSDNAIGDARYAEAQELRSDAKYNLTNSVHILYAGDGNLFNGSYENAYRCLTGQTTADGINWSDTSAIWTNTNPTQAYDPMSKTSPPTTVTWTNAAVDHASYLYSDATEGSYSMSSRIDFQLPNALMFAVYNSHGGVQIAPDTSDPYDVSNFPSAKYPYAFETFGNNGSTPLGATATIPFNNSLDELTNAVPNAATVYADMQETGSGSSFIGSDHYPIVGDYVVVQAAAAPSASFTATPTNGVAPLAVNFTDTSAGSPTSWAWTFGDAGTETVQDPSHAYTTSGVYTVTLVVSNAGGSSTSTVANLITVLPPVPVASFTASPPTTGAAPLSVSFTDSSSGSITGWAWAFGDGNTSSIQNPLDVYVNPGSYTVREIVSGAGGYSTSTVVNLVGVYDPFAWWQLNYFGSTNSDANTSPDGDYTGTGMSNSNKFAAGFNPTNSAAYLHIISIVDEGSTDVVVTYLGPNGDNTYTPGILSRTNVLDFMTGDAGGNYTNGGWQDTGQTNILSGGDGSGMVTNMTDTAIPSAPTNLYYRVRVLLP